MLKDIVSIKMSGANFCSMTMFDFFNPREGDKVKTNKGTLLYGRNGTGKSTIAKAFRSLSGEIVPSIVDVIIYDHADRPMDLSDEERNRIFVFDEDYVYKNVKLQQDHLETIVMLGEAADLTEKIMKAETERDVAKSIFERQDNAFQEYCDAGNVKSPKHYIPLLIQALRGDDNWAGRDKQIDGKRQNTAVGEGTYKQFFKLIPSKPKTELITDFKLKLKELEAAKSGSAVIDTVVPKIKVNSTYSDEIAKQLLAEYIEKPELTQREKKLLALAQSAERNQLSERLKVFGDSETFDCPYCYQPVTTEYKNSLVLSIEKILNRAVIDHQNLLQNQIIDPVTIDLNAFEKLENYWLCSNLADELNDSILQNSNLLERKKDNAYEPITSGFVSIGEIVNQLKTALEELEKERVKHNKDSQCTAPIISELKRINGEIAHCDIISLANQLNSQQKEYERAARNNHDLKTKLEEKNKVVFNLESQRKNIHLAVDAINACMKYIFFADDRLKIEYEDEKYKLLSHGNNVKPCDVSVGERNIIGLSYFFTSILEGQDEANAYENEYLLIIDDPVSSYDLESKIGILSFLKYKLSLFLEGNNNTKALIMTHDLMTFYDIHKMFEEIVRACKRKKYPNEPKFNRFELRDGCLSTFLYRSRQEYSEILKIIYSYASGQVTENVIVIGNMMRQALEAFSTFVYKKGIEDVSTDNQILGLLMEDEFISYFKNLMYRLVLHGGSHKEEQIKAMHDFQFFNLISDVEKQRTAKDILCFIYLLNNKHLLAHLEGCGNVTAVLNSWCQDIKSRAAVV